MVERHPKHPHEDLSRSGLGIGDVDEFEDFGPSVGVDLNDLHGWSGSLAAEDRGATLFECRHTFLRVFRLKQALLQLALQSQARF